MLCEEFEMLLNDRLDNRQPLDFDQETSLEEHRQSCPQCRQLALALAVGLDSLHTSPPEASNIDLADRVLRELSPRRSLPMVRFRYAAAALAAAASLAIVAWKFMPADNAPKIATAAPPVEVQPIKHVEKKPSQPSVQPQTGLAAVFNWMPEMSNSRLSIDAASAALPGELEDEVLNSLAPVTNSTTGALGALQSLLPPLAEEPRS